MTVAELADICERHIKTLPREVRLQLVALIARELAEEEASTVEEPRRSILKLRGLGEEIWNGVDGQEYVNRLRDERDERPSRSSMTPCGASRASGSTRHPSSTSA